MVRDPVCKLEVNPLTASASTKYKGDTYYFCTARCKSYFDKNPAKYAKKKEKKKGFGKRRSKK